MHFYSTVFSRAQVSKAQTSKPCFYLIQRTGTFAYLSECCWTFFLLSNLLKSNIIHEILTSPTYAGMLPRVRALRLHSNIMLHMVQIFIPHSAICCFQAPYQGQHIHYKTATHTTTTVPCAYSHLFSAVGYCSLCNAWMKYSFQEDKYLKKNERISFYFLFSF